MRQRLIRALKPAHAVSVENMVGPGTPDINCMYGWIECKWLRDWPKRPGTPVRLAHDLQPQQRCWLRARRRAGGPAYVMLQCKREWLLFDGACAADVLGTSTRAELILCACMYNSNGLDAGMLRDFLSETSEELFKLQYENRPE